MPRSRSRTSRLPGAQGVRERDPRENSGSSAVGTPTPARTFSGRLLALVLVAVLIVFLAAPTTKIYLEQRAEIAELERSVAQMETEGASLEAQLEQWSDETYIQQQARERLLYVMPGERSYIVVGAEEMQGAVVDSSAAQAEAAKPAWVDALWQSVVASAYAEDPVAPENADEGPLAGATAGPLPGGGSAASTAAGASGGTSPDPGASATAHVPGAGATGATETPSGIGPTAGPADGTDEPQGAATENRGTSAEEGTP